jgi:hypothetical protein
MAFNVSPVWVIDGFTGRDGVRPGVRLRGSHCEDQSKSECSLGKHGIQLRADVAESGDDKSEAEVGRRIVISEDMTRGSGAA